MLLGDVLEMDLATQNILCRHSHCIAWRIFDLYSHNVYVVFVYSSMVYLCAHNYFYIQLQILCTSVLISDKPPPLCSQFAAKKRPPRPRASEPVPVDPELEVKINELDKMTEPQVNDKLQAMLVSN